MGWIVLFETEDGIREAEEARGLGDVYEEQLLNQAVIDQRNEIDVLQIQIEHLNKKLKSAQGSIIADEKDETPPPHY